MIVLFHIASALASILCATYLLVRPSKGTLYASYGLVVSTLTSGAYLVLTTHTPLLHACLTGVAYLGVVSIGVVSGHAKLASQEQ